MSKILSFGEKNLKVSKNNIFKTVWDGFKSLDRFIKFYIVFGILVIVATPAIISSYLIFSPHAETTTRDKNKTTFNAPAIGQSAQRSSSLVSSGTSLSVSTVTPIVVDKEVVTMFNLINDYRIQNGKSALKVDMKIHNAAQWFAVDLGTTIRDLSHIDSLGRNPFERMSAFGYDWGVGENGGVGAASAQTIFDRWRSSPGHNSNMLNPDAQVIGIGYAQGWKGDWFTWYWVTDFGSYVSEEGIYQERPVDSDGDGFSDEVEIYLGTDPNKACITDPDTEIDKSRPGHPSLTWPADLNTTTGGINSYNKINILDTASFMAPEPRRMNTSPGDVGYDKRWDIAPGKGVLSKDINASDLTLLSVLAPPMFSGQKAYNGRTCTP